MSDRDHLYKKELLILQSNYSNHIDSHHGSKPPLDLIDVAKSIDTISGTLTTYPSGSTIQSIESEYHNHPIHSINSSSSINSKHQVKMSSKYISQPTTKKILVIKKPPNTLFNKSLKKSSGHHQKTIVDNKDIHCENGKPVSKGSTVVLKDKHGNVIDLNQSKTVSKGPVIVLKDKHGNVVDINQSKTVSKGPVIVLKDKHGNVIDLNQPKKSTLKVEKSVNQFKQEMIQSISDIEINEPIPKHQSKSTILPMNFTEYFPPPLMNQSPDNVNKIIKYDREFMLKLRPVNPTLQTLQTESKSTVSQPTKLAYPSSLTSKGITNLQSFHAFITNLIQPESFSKESIDPLCLALSDMSQQMDNNPSFKSLYDGYFEKIEKIHKQCSDSFIKKSLDLVFSLRSKGWNRTWEQTRVKYQTYLDDQ